MEKDKAFLVIPKLSKSDEKEFELDEKELDVVKKELIGRLKAKSKGKMAVDNIGHLCYPDFNFQPRTDSDGKILQGKI